MAAESGGTAPPPKRSGSDSRGAVEPWQLASFSEASGESVSSAADLEVSSPPLVLISSRVKGAGGLERCVDVAAGAKAVRYAYEQTTLAKLRQMVAAALKGRLALSIALIVHGYPGCFKLCAQRVSECASVHVRAAQFFSGGRGWHVHA